MAYSTHLSDLLPLFSDLSCADDRLTQRECVGSRCLKKVRAPQQVSVMVAERWVPREVAWNLGARPGNTGAADEEQEKHAAYATEYVVKVEADTRTDP